MKQKRVLSIKSKVIKVKDIEHLAELLKEIYDNLDTKYRAALASNPNKRLYLSSPQLKFAVNTTDGIEYSSEENLDLFKEEGILDSKVISSLNFSVIYYSENYALTVSITDSRFSRFGGNSVQIESTDADWVNATFQRLQDALSQWENQDSKIMKNRWLISSAVSIMAVFIFITVLRLIFGAFGMSYSKSYAFAGIIGIFPLYFIIVSFEDYLSKLWPNMEFIPEPEHLRTLSQKRNNLNWIFTAIIIPFAIALIFALVDI